MVVKDTLIDIKLFYMHSYRKLHIIDALNIKIIADVYNIFKSISMQR